MNLEQYDRPQDGISFMESALAVLCALILVVIAALAAALLMYRWDEAADAQITAHHVEAAKAKKEMPPCDFVIVQYGRYHEKRNPECVKGTREIPNHILTLPVGQ